MSLIDSRLMVVDSRHTATGGFCGFNIPISPLIMPKAPKSVKLLDAVLTVPVGIMTRTISPDANIGNNHVVIETADGTTSVDVFFPTLTKTLAPATLPATDASGVGPNPATNAQFATFIQNHLNLHAPAGYVFTVSWATFSGGGRFSIIEDARQEVRINFNTFDTIGDLLGFGPADYTVTQLPIYSVVLKPDFTVHNPLTDDGYALIKSDIAYSSSNKVIIPDAVNYIAKNDGVLFFTPYGSIANFSENPVCAYKNVENSRLSQQMAQKISVYTPLSLPSDTSQNIYFWLKFKSGVPINNSFVSSWAMRFTANFSETTVPPLRII